MSAEDFKMAIIDYQIVSMFALLVTLQNGNNIFGVSMADAVHINAVKWVNKYF